MDKVQRHLMELDRKVDRLYEMMAGIGSLVATLSAAEAPSGATNPYLTFGQRVGSPAGREGQLPPPPTHEDAMVGGSEGQPTESSIEQRLTPETQIQRLTAQLTAAYNRIADLEEKLVAVRPRPFRRDPKVQLGAEVSGWGEGE